MIVILHDPEVRIEHDGSRLQVSASLSPAPGDSYSVFRIQDHYDRKSARCFVGRVLGFVGGRDRRGCRGWYLFRNRVLGLRE